VGADAVLERAPEDKRDAPELAALRAKMALAAQAANLGNPAELERRLEQNPKDHQARFDLAMIQNAKGERDKAADSLLAIVKADRTWNDDGARAQLLQFFEAWGMADEATLSARRKLSSVLFS
jgi:putative thioredoxin